MLIPSDTFVRRLFIINNYAKEMRRAKESNLSMQMVKVPAECGD